MEFGDHERIELIRKYDRPVPRYAGYPAVTHFRDDISPAVVEEWVGQLNPEEPVAIYIHLPFCPSLCAHCGCNIRVTHSRNLMRSYLSALHDEINLLVQRLPARMKVCKLHLGGGTPTYYAAEDLTALIGFIKARFILQHDAEISIDVDPRRLSDRQAAYLRKAGVNQINLGVLDTNPQVQEAIGRNQAPAQIIRAFEMLRTEGIGAIHADLLYGLPRQTSASISRSAAEIASLHPAGIGLYAYAHMPWMKAHQKLLEQYGLPASLDRMGLFGAAADVFFRQGYIPIGVDQFSLPGEPLALAARQGGLHRSLLGYTTREIKVLIGFGVSAVSTYPQGYVQNTTSIKDYLHQNRQKSLPIWKGLRLSDMDRCSGEIIERLLCQFEADIAEIAAMHHLTPSSLPVHSPNLKQMISDGLVVADRDGILVITDRGRPFAHMVAACFDGYIWPRE